MSAPKILARVLTTRVGPHIELALALQGGEIVKVLATHEQIDMLVDELEDILNAPDEPEPDGPPQAA